METTPIGSVAEPGRCEKRDRNIPADRTTLQVILSRRKAWFAPAIRFLAAYAVCTMSIGLLLVFSGCKSETSPNAELNETEGTIRRPDVEDQDQVLPDKTKTGETVWDGDPVFLIDSDSLKGWETIEYGGEGECRVEKGVLTIESGDPMTGVSITRDDLPTTNYEISLQAKRVEGIDMFCGLTFPVNESHCTLVVGGWAGSTVGLSCIDDLDASSNDTTRIMLLESDKWYRIRVRVLPGKIVAWINDEQVVSQDLAGHKISLRTETEPCSPFGLCTFQTTAETRDLQVRRIKPPVPIPGNR